MLVGVNCDCFCLCCLSKWYNGPVKKKSRILVSKQYFKKRKLIDDTQLRCTDWVETIWSARLWLTAVPRCCQSPGNPAAAHETSSQCPCVSVPGVTMCATVRENKDCVATKQKHHFGVCAPQVCRRCSIWVSNQSVWPLYLSGISHCVLACCYKRFDGTWACLRTHSLSHIATRQRRSTQDSGKALYWGSIFHSNQLYGTDEPFMSIHFQASFE